MKHVRISLLLVMFLSLILLASTVVVAAPSPGTPGAASGGFGNSLRTLFDSFYNGFGWFNQIAETLINFIPGSEGDPNVQLAIFWIRFALLILVFSILLVGVRSAFGEGHKGLGVAAFIIALISTIAIPSALLVTIARTYGALVVFGLVGIVIFSLLFFRHLVTSRVDNSQHPALWRGFAAVITFLGFSIVTAMGQGFKEYEFTLLVGDTYNVIVTVLMLLLIYDVFKFFSALFRGGLARSGVSTPGAGVGGWFRWAHGGITSRLPGGSGATIGDIGAPGTAGAVQAAVHAGEERAEVQHEAEEHAEHGERIEADITDLSRRVEGAEREIENLNLRAEERERAFQEHSQLRAAIAARLTNYFRHLHGFFNLEIAIRQHYKTAPDAEKLELGRRYHSMIEQKKRVLAEVETLLRDPILVDHEIASLRQLRDELKELETRAHDFLIKERRLAQREAKEAAALGEEARKLGYQDIVEMADAIRQMEVRGTELETREARLADQIVNDLTQYHTEAGQLEEIQAEVQEQLRHCTHASELIHDTPDMSVSQRLTFEREIKDNLGTILALFNKDSILRGHINLLHQKILTLLPQQKQVIAELKRVEDYVFHHIKLARGRLEERRRKP